MNCPHCKLRFTYWYTFRIINPWKHRCASCRTLLTAGKRATLAISLAGLVGLAIAFVAIMMEEAKLWTAGDSFVWFAIAIPLAVLSYQYWCWKWVTFTEKHDAGASLLGSRARAPASGPGMEWGVRQARAAQGLPPWFWAAVAVACLVICLLLPRSARRL